TTLLTTFGTLSTLGGRRSCCRPTPQHTRGASQPLGLCARSRAPLPCSPHAPTKGLIQHMDFIGTILWPIKWAIEAILVAFHTLLTAIGLDPDDGVTWVLAIVGLVLVVRALLIPLFVRQIKNQRRMLEV